MRFEAPVGFEPTNKGFADLPLKPLGYSAVKNFECRIENWYLNSAFALNS